MANAKVTITIKTNCAYFSTVFELHSVLVFMKGMFTVNTQYLLVENSFT